MPDEPGERMKIRSSYCCDPLGSPPRNLPASVASVETTWRCPTCRRRWKCEFHFNRDGTFSRGEATPAWGWGNWRDNWPIAMIPLAAAFAVLILGLL